MTTLREAAQQALEALLTYEQYIQPLTNYFGGPRVPEEGSASAKVDAAITTLRAALAEPDYWEEEARRYASNADYWRKRCVSCGGALPATGQDDRTGECVCGEPTALNTVHRTDGPCYVAEPVQEPVAWRFQSAVGGWAYGSEPPLGSKYPAYPLYTAPPQRKPLTDEEIDDLSRTMVKGDKSVNWLCRAIERAHGIGGQP